jgi:urea transport system substrate-binding protein
MGVVTLSTEEFIAAPVESVFERFGAGHGAGWVFDAVCDRLDVGSVVTMHAPFGGEPVDIFGRVSAVRRPCAITIVHDQPWRGRLRLRFLSTAGGTQVRLWADIDERGLEWLMRRNGFPVQRPGAPVGHRVGLLTSKSGSASLFAAATENVASLAVDELNAEGGIARRPIELLVADDATDPPTGVVEANRLVRAGCRTLFVTTTSATWDAVATSLKRSGVLLIQPQMNEGGGESRLRIRLGERPTTQLVAAAIPLMRAAGGRRWFLAGNDYIWPRRLNAVAREVLPFYGATLVGERYAPLGVRDHTALVEAVIDSNADIILSSFVGADAASFERQCHAAGVRDHAITLAPAMDESTLERIGATAAPGIRGVSGYFQRLQTVGNDSLVQRYRDAFGRWAPPLSSLSEAVFEAMLMWAGAARRVKTCDPQSVANEMRVGRFDLPRGTVTLDGTGHVEQVMYLAEARGDTFDAMTPIATAQ